MKPGAPPGFTPESEGTERDRQLDALIRLAPTRANIEAQLLALCRDIYSGVFRNPALPLPGRPFRVLHAHDFHVPTTDMEAVETMLRRECPVDLAVVSELSSSDTFSPFNDRLPSDYAVEAIEAGKILEMMLGHGVKRIVLLRSNHADRARKWARRAAENCDQARVASDALTSYRDKLMGLERKGIITRHEFGHVQVGGMLASHGDKFLLTQCASPEKYLNKLGAQANVFRVKLDEVQLMAVPHEHRRNEGYARGRQIAVWTLGMMCYMQRYSVESKPAGYTEFPQVVGYGVTQHDKAGRVVLSDSRNVHLWYTRLQDGVERW